MNFLKVLAQELLVIIGTIVMDPFLFKVFIISLLLSGLAAKSHFPFHIFWPLDFLLVFIVLWIIFLFLMVLSIIKALISGGEIKMNGKRS
ncbi:MAG: hypothetical protein PHE24_04390 [Patescibacteria group bacterium]|nr:hypothetical protein [Patescibacteria group bacterium]